MLTIVGTVPSETFPLSRGPVAITDDALVIDGIHVPINRGTPALIGAAVMAGEVLGVHAMEAVLAGDIGLGAGSRAIYALLTRILPDMAVDTLAFHYLQPDADWHNRILFAVEEMQSRPRLVADAGFMYAAKMCGQAGLYDLFTPDVGELAFLADETAPHPFYTRGFILHQDNQVPDLISRAYEHGNGPRHLLVKGSTDYVVEGGEILARINGPSVDVMEAMGGTGDTLTGLVCALIDSGRTVPEAARIAARANRLAGVYAHPTPATQVIEIIRQIPKALAEVLESPDAGELPGEHRRAGKRRGISDSPKVTTSMLRPDMTVLDIVSRFRATEAVFKKWDRKAGECICCHALFETLETVAEKYGLNLAALQEELEKAVSVENGK